MEFNLGLKDTDLEGLSDDDLTDLAEQGREFMKAEEQKIVEAFGPSVSLESSGIPPRQFWFEEDVWRGDIMSGKVTWVQLEIAQEAKVRAVSAEAIVATTEHILYTRKERRARENYLYGREMKENEKEEDWIF